MRQVLETADAVTTKVAEVILVVLGAVLVVVVFSGVLGRYIVGSTPFFIEELSRYLLIWLGSIGASVGLRNGEFVSVDLFVDLLPTARREGIKKVTTVILTVFLIFLFVAGAKVVCQQRSQRAATLPVSMALPYLALPLGIALCLPHCFLTLLGNKEEVQ